MLTFFFHVVNWELSQEWQTKLSYFSQMIHILPVNFLNVFVYFALIFLTQADSHVKYSSENGALGWKTARRDTARRFIMHTLPACSQAY